MRTIIFRAALAVATTSLAAACVEQAAPELQPDPQLEQDVREQYANWVNSPAISGLVTDVRVDVIDTIMDVAGRPDDLARLLGGFTRPMVRVVPVHDDSGRFEVVWEYEETELWPPSQADVDAIVDNQVDLDMIVYQVVATIEGVPMRYVAAARRMEGSSTVVFDPVLRIPPPDFFNPVVLELEMGPGGTSCEVTDHNVPPQPGVCKDVTERCTQSAGYQYLACPFRLWADQEVGARFEYTAVMHTSCNNVPNVGCQLAGSSFTESKKVDMRICWDGQHDDGSCDAYPDSSKTSCGWLDRWYYAGGIISDREQDELLATTHINNQPVEIVNGAHYQWAWIGIIARDTSTYPNISNLDDGSGGEQNLTGAPKNGMWLKLLTGAYYSLAIGHSIGKLIHWLADSGTTTTSPWPDYSDTGVQGDFRQVSCGPIVDGPADPGDGPGGPGGPGLPD